MFSKTLETSKCSIFRDASNPDNVGVMLRFLWFLPKVLGDEEKLSFVKGDLLAVNRNDTILISLGHFSIFTHFFGYAEIDQENLNFNGKKSFILEFHREFQS